MKTGIDGIDFYAEGVRDGSIDVCRWVRLAVERHYDNLRNQRTKKFPFFFDPGAAWHFFEFCSENLQHYEGLVKGDPLIAEPWQQFIYGSVFGWHKIEEAWPENYPIRRFRTGVIIVPKKNGKSIWSGGVGVYMLEADGWPAAQCYTLAKNQTHAKDLGYRAATVMVENSETLKNDYVVNRGAASVGIYCKANNSFYKPITSKPESEDGRNVHFCGPDEVKDWTDFEIYDIMRNGAVNAPNHLFLSTTTAGSNLISLGYDQQKYTEKVLKGDIIDEAFFGIIYGVDESDKKNKDGTIKDYWWCDPRVWKKANPNYGISVFEDTMQSMIIDAKESPSKRSAFQTKHLNIWHTSSEEFIAEEKWEACGQKTGPPPMKNVDLVLESFGDRRCYGGLDLGAVSDFTSFVLEFEDPYEVVCFFWIPKDTIKDRKGSEMIQKWVEGGWIATTDGDWTDHDHVEEFIKEVAGKVDLREIAFDRYKMNQMVTHLMDSGIEMVEHGQGYLGMNTPIFELENGILKKEIEHFGNPVLSWMCGNVVIRKDPGGLRKFDKDKAYDKIDGMVSLAMAHGRAKLYQEDVSEWDEMKTL